MIEWSFGRFGTPSIAINPAADVSSVIKKFRWLTTSDYYRIVLTYCGFLITVIKGIPIKHYKGTTEALNTAHASLPTSPAALLRPVDILQLLHVVPGPCPPRPFACPQPGLQKSRLRDMMICDQVC